MNMISPKWNAFNVGTDMVILKRLSIDSASRFASSALFNISLIGISPMASSLSYSLYKLGTTSDVFQSRTLIN